MGWNPVKEAKKAVQKEAKKVVDSILKPAADQIKRELDRTGAGVRGAVKKRGQEMERVVNKAADDGKKKLYRTRDKIEQGLKEDLPELIEDVAEKIAREASEHAIGEVLDNAADVIEIMAPDSFTLTFGIELALVVQGEVTVSFTFPNPTAKLTEIRGWAKKPPKGRAKIIECIKDFGPESLSAEFKVSGNGIGAEWSGESKYDRIDAFLEKHGVS